MLISILVAKKCGGSVKIMDRDIRDTRGWVIKFEDIPGGVQLNVVEAGPEFFQVKRKTW